MLAISHRFSYITVLCCICIILHCVLYYIALKLITVMVHSSMHMLHAASSLGLPKLHIGIEQALTKHVQQRSPKKKRFFQVQCGVPIPFHLF